MIHIGSHFYDARRDDGVDVNHPKFDIWTLSHLYRLRLISPENYLAAVDYAERPSSENRYTWEWKPQEMRGMEERNSRTTYDFRKGKMPGQTGDRHKREVHEPTKLRCCPVVTCKRHTKGFPRKYNLFEHMKRCHPNVNAEEQTCFHGDEDQQQQQQARNNEEVSYLRPVGYETGQKRKRSFSIPGPLQSP
jgi:hypothetical protein